MDTPPELHAHINQLVRRLEHVEREQSRHFSRREPAIARYYQVRLARTVAIPGEGSEPATYPINGAPLFGYETPQTPNTFPIVFLDGGYDLVAAMNSPYYDAHNTVPQTFVHNLTGDYIPVGTELEVFQLTGTVNTAALPGEWWCERQGGPPHRIKFSLVATPSGTGLATVAGEVISQMATADIGIVYDLVGETVNLSLDLELFPHTQDGAIGFATWDGSGAYVVDVIDQWTRRASARLAEDVCGVGFFDVTDFEPMDSWPYSLTPEPDFEGGEGTCTNNSNGRGTGPSGPYSIASAVWVELDVQTGLYNAYRFELATISPAGLVTNVDDEELVQAVHTISAERCAEPTTETVIELTDDCEEE